MVLTGLKVCKSYSRKAAGERDAPSPYPTQFTFIDCNSPRLEYKSAFFSQKICKARIAMCKLQSTRPSDSYARIGIIPFTHALGMSLPIRPVTLVPPLSAWDARPADPAATLGFLHVCSTTLTKR